MEFTSKQKQLLEDAANWWETDDPRPFLIEGYAGTGKTTMVEPLLELSFRTPPKRAAALAPTGKAVSVLRRKVPTLSEIRTIHSACYHFAGQLSKEELEELKKEAARTKGAERRAILKKIKDAGSPYWQERTCLSWESRTEDTNPKHLPIVFVDEASMVNGSLGKIIELLTAKLRLIVIRDPMQLPPVPDGKGSGPWLAREACYPTKRLTQVVRNRSGILSLATHIRNENSLRSWADEEQEGVSFRRSPSVTRLAKYDVVICGLNKTRRHLNDRMRRHYGFDKKRVPQPGEPLICLKNNQTFGVFNGETFRVISADEDAMRLQRDDGGEVIVPTEMEGDSADPYKTIEFAFAYAITCHKSQGSEYPKVCVFNESRAFKQDASKWLYTAVTRAQKRLLVVQP